MGENGLNHTQIIMTHSEVLAKLQEQNKHILEKLELIDGQIKAQYELMNRYDVKQDELIKDIVKIKTERNMIVWLIGLFGTILGGVITKLFSKIGG